MSHRWVESFWPYEVHAESWTDYERITMVRVEVHVHGSEVLHARASAVCHPDDVFQKSIGEEVAFRRALLKCLPKLEKATRAYANRCKKQMYSTLATT